MGQAFSKRAPNEEVAALHEGVRANDCAAVQRVLERNSSPHRLITARLKGAGITSLHKAAAAPSASESLPILQLLIDALASSTYKQERMAVGRPEHGPVPSGQAMRRVHKRVAAAVSAGSARRSITPLMAACAAGSADKVRILLACGADATLTDREEAATALHFAARAGSAACVDLLLDDQLLVRRRSSSLFGEIQSSTLCPLRALPMTDAMGWHPYKDARAMHGLSPLHYAALFGPSAAEGERRSAASDTVLVLLRAGADPTALSGAHSTPPGGRLHRQCTALHCAVASCNLPVAMVLVEWSTGGPRRRVDLRRLRDAEGLRPFDLARRLGLPATFLELLDPARPLQRRRRRRRTTELTGPLPLVLLAAAAARKRLLDDLPRVEEELRKQRVEISQSSRMMSPFFQRLGSGLLAPFAGRSPPTSAVQPSENVRSTNGRAIVDRAPSVSVAAPRSAPYSGVRLPPWQSSPDILALGLDGSFEGDNEEGELQHGFGSDALRRMLSDDDNDGTRDVDSEEEGTSPQEEGEEQPGLFDLDGYLSLSTGNDASHHGASTAASTIVKVRHSRMRSHSSDLSNQCPVCFDAEACIPMGGCGHEFCGSCLRTLLQQASGKAPLTCPLCRGVVLKWGA